MSGFGGLATPGLTKSDVVNNLTSTATDAPLSAKQGKMLSDRIVNHYNDFGAVNMLDWFAENVLSGQMVHFRTTSTTTGQPGTGMFLIGYCIRAGVNNIFVQAYEMSKPELIYQNSSTNGGTSWIGWKKYRSDYKYYYNGVICSSSTTSSGDVFSYFPGIAIGAYLVILYRNGYVWDDAASVYIVQHGSESSVYGKLTIKEGSSEYCPKLNSSGNVTLPAVSQNSIGIFLIKLNN